MAMIRIPLWWSFKRTLGKTDSYQRTFEYRAPDAMANAYLLFAGISIAIKYGFKNHAESLKMTEELQLEGSAKNSRRLERLPLSCSESVRNLRKDRKCYEEDGVFPKAIIDAAIEKLVSYDDSNLAQMLRDEPQKIEKLIQDYLYYG